MPENYKYMPIAEALDILIRAVRHGSPDEVDRAVEVAEIALEEWRELNES